MATLRLAWSLLGLGLGLSAAESVAAHGRLVTRAGAHRPRVLERHSNANATCTLGGTDDLSLLRGMKRNCTSIVISGLSVPGGVTLDLRDLINGTSVRTPIRDCVVLMSRFFPLFVCVSVSVFLLARPPFPVIVKGTAPC